MSSSQLPAYKASKPAPGVFTTSNGAPSSTATASQSAGAKGPLLLGDFNFLDHMAHFDRERIPERVVHAKGAGAFGYFETTHDITRYSRACVFSQIGKRTKLAVRFSTVGGESGSADTVRDPRGFAVKMYTEDGNWDLVGNNTPIFFIRDPILFPSFIHTQKRNPTTHLKDANMTWDFFSLRPETTHQMSFLFSDRGIPDGYRFMNGYGSHTYKLVNAKNEAFYCKFHWKCDQGVRNLPVDVADRLASEDPDYAIRDLYDAIARKDFPSWTLYVQTMSFDEAAKCSFNPFDVTKIWPHGQYPLQQVGRMVLNDNPRNYFAEVEQIAFAPAHLIPGIEASPDKMLQGRLFSYVDTHRWRLGTNYQQIPVNCPFAQKRGGSYQRDGAMTVNGNQGSAPNYFPNSFNGPQPDAGAAQHKFPVTGDVDRYETGDEDNFSQVRTFFNKVLDADARERLCRNVAGSLAGAEEFIRKRAIANLNQVDAKYGGRVAELVAEIRSKPAKALSLPPPSALNPPRQVPKNFPVGDTLNSVYARM